VSCGEKYERGKSQAEEEGLQNREFSAMLREGPERADLQPDGMSV
jgi:hypothetical protein